MSRCLSVCLSVCLCVTSRHGWTDQDRPTSSGTLSQTLDLEIFRHGKRQFDRRPSPVFITLSVHVCVQHSVGDSVRRAPVHLRQPRLDDVHYRISPRYLENHGQYWEFPYAFTVGNIYRRRVRLCAVDTRQRKHA